MRVVVRAVLRMVVREERGEGKRGREKKVARPGEW
jgi:hypothetical protein